MKRVLLLLSIFFISIGTLTAQEVRTIKGRVLETGTQEPLPGATIFIAPDQHVAKDYQPQGVVSDYDGNYLFTLPKSVRKVVVSFIGYKSLMIELTEARSVYNVELEEDRAMLDEVVVTGYQKIERRKLTSAVKTLDSKDLAQVGVPSVDQMLAGQVAGVVVTPVSGAPGASSQVRIRGTVSLSGSSEPLWVLDGIPLDGDQVPDDFTSQSSLDELRNTSIAGLNPADIENITILKDAAATAIYGARAANGVIVITSKRGREGKMQVQFSADMFYTARPNADRLDLLSASEKVDLELSLLRNPLHSYRSAQGDVARIIERARLTDAYKRKGLDALTPEVAQRISALRTQGSDWFGEIYEPTFNQQYTLSLSGGSDRTHYYVSGGYYAESGTTKGTSFKRYNLTSNTDFKITDRFTTRLSIFANQNDRATYLTNGENTNAQYYSRNVNPYRDVLDADGRYVYDPDVLNSDDQPIPFNYREEQENTKYALKGQSLKTVLELEYSPLNWLRATTQLGLQFENNSTERFANKESYYTRQYAASNVYSKGGKRVTFLPEGGIIQNWNDRFFQYNWRTQVFMNHNFNDTHDVDFMAGVELRRNDFTNIHTKGFGFNENSHTTKPLVFPEGYRDTDKPALRQYQKQFIENAFVSFFSTASYTYKERYTVFGSLRLDGSNLFGVNPKYRYLPLWSISGAWNASREEFMRDVTWVSNLRVRASYGLQGNIDKNTSPFVKGEWNTTSFFPGISEPTVSVTTPPNQYLRWEKTGNVNAGIDLGLWDRLNISFDYYYRNSDDLISLKSIPLENGFNFVNLNWGRVENRGWELSINSTNISTKDWTWTTGLNISKNRSKVLEYNVADNSYTPSLKGYPVNAAFAIPTAGIDPETGLMTFRGENGQRVGYIDFYKLSTGIWGDVISGYTPEQMRNLFKYIGDRDPDLTGGLNTKLRYKDFDFSVFANFVINRLAQRQPSYKPTHVNPGVNYTREILSAWSHENPSGTLPKVLNGNMSGDTEEALASRWISSYDPSGSFFSYDIWFKKMSYLRINSIRLGYTLTPEVLKSKSINRVRFNLECKNPFVISTDYSGFFDPEGYGNIYVQPIAKTVSLGVQITL